VRERGGCAFDGHFLENDGGRASRFHWLSRHGLVKDDGKWCGWMCVAGCVSFTGRDGRAMAYETKARHRAGGALLEKSALRGMCALAHQQCLARALDRVVDLAVEARRDAGCAPGHDLSSLGDVALEEFRILPVDRVERDVHAAARHGPVGLAEIGAALRCFWLAHVT